MLVSNSCPPLSITNHNPTLAQAGECQDNLADILFILDESGSVEPQDFQTTLTFVYNVVDRLEIGPNDVKVAVLTFDSVVRMRFHFNRFSTKQVSVDNVITRSLSISTLHKISSLKSFAKVHFLLWIITINFVLIVLNVCDILYSVR